MIILAESGAIGCDFGKRQGRKDVQKKVTHRWAGFQYVKAGAVHRHMPWWAHVTQHETTVGRDAIPGRFGFASKHAISTKTLDALITIIGYV